MSTSELKACLNAHGLYNSFQFVLRLSPEVHRKIEALPKGIIEGRPDVDSLSVPPRDYPLVAAQRFDVGLAAEPELSRPGLYELQPPEKPARCDRTEEVHAAVRRKLGRTGRSRVSGGDQSIKGMVPRLTVPAARLAV